MEKLLDRFNSKWTVNKETECWEWNGTINYKGYGIFKVSGSGRNAHRVGYELYVGEIEPGLVIDHLCRVRNCVNPKHLEAVTVAENSRRGLRTNKLCEHGAGWSRCKLGCATGYYREWNAANKDKSKVNSAKYHLAHREERLAANKKWRDENRKVVR